LVTIRTCPICRKAVYGEAHDTVVAKVRGASETMLTYFHDRCYPGDEGSLFERVEQPPERDEPTD